MVTYQHFSTSLKWIAALTLVVSVTACGADPKPITQSASTVVPTESLQDLVTYGDVLVKFNVMKETEIPAADDEVKRGEGTTTRQVVASQDGEALWTRPSRKEPGADPPSPWVISDGGWFFTKNERVPLGVEGRAPLVVGKHYLAVRTFSSLGGDTNSEWFSLAYIPLQGDRVQFDPQFVEDGDSSYARALQGLTVLEAANLLENSAVDPEVAPYMDLDAAKRYQKKFG
ncbi:MAG: hypothetical protein JWN06_4002 [Propionibacteriaceae bacterium]|jgi:hypothetical protein|nr:hypothetical protein [Propionibacteriaceae bacterium]